MSLTDLLQTIGIIVSIVFAIWQMRVLTQYTRAATAAAIVNKYDDVNRLIFDNPGLFRRMSEPYRDPELDDDSDRMDTLAAMIFNAIEQVYTQHQRYQLVTEADWTIWERALAHHLQKRYLREWWSHNDIQYGPNYRKAVDKVLKRTATPQ
jgi:hypothetical protein